MRKAGIPLAGVSGIFQDIADVWAQGRDERSDGQAFHDGRECLSRFVKALASASSSTPP